MSASAALLAAVASGELTPSEAAELGKLVEAHVRAIEVTEIQERLARLEEQQAVEQRLGGKDVTCAAASRCAFVSWRALAALVVFFLAWGRDDAEIAGQLDEARARGVVGRGDLVVRAHWNGRNGPPPSRWIVGRMREWSNEEGEALTAEMERRIAAKERPPGAASQPANARKTTPDDRRGAVRGWAGRAGVLMSGTQFGCAFDGSIRPLKRTRPGARDQRQTGALRREALGRGCSYGTRSILTPRLR